VQVANLPDCREIALFAPDTDSFRSVDSRKCLAFLSLCQQLPEQKCQSRRGRCCAFILRTVAARCISNTIVETSFGFMYIAFFYCFSSEITRRMTHLKTFLAVFCISLARLSSSVFVSLAIYLYHTVLSYRQ
jgi:hypothetical protein